MHVMTQTLRGGDGPHLPHGLSVVNSYTSDYRVQMSCSSGEEPNGLITIAKGIKVTQVVAANVVPPVRLTRRTLERLDKIQGSQHTRMSDE